MNCRLFIVSMLAAATFGSAADPMTLLMRATPFQEYIAAEWPFWDTVNTASPGAWDLNLQLEKPVLENGRLTLASYPKQPYTATNFCNGATSIMISVWARASVGKWTHSLVGCGYLLDAGRTFGINAQWNFTASNRVDFVAYNTAGAWYEYGFCTSAVPPTAWTHYLFAWRTTGGTGTPDIDIYINGENRVISTAVAGTRPTVVRGERNFILGSGDTANRPHVGDLSRFRVWTNFPAGIEAETATQCYLEGPL